MRSSRSDQDYRELARAAVSGDQTALDMLAQTTSRKESTETATFFVGTDRVSNMMTQYNLQLLERGQLLQPTISGKLSGRPADSDYTLVGTNFFAYVTGESTIRMINVSSTENLMLRLNTELGYASNENLVCITYCQTR
ncbi:unnamed protein product, partial [Didymodactylos carnosus]